MFCRRCGYALPRQSTLCPHCGTVVSPTSQAQQHVPLHASTSYQPQTGAPTSHQPSYQEYVTPQQIVAQQQQQSLQYAVITEIVFNLFGIYGIGWILAGETLVGVLLLLGSLFIYWPLLIILTISTFGLGLFCFTPLSILLVAFNAFFLHLLVQQKRRRYRPQPQ